MSDPVQEKKPSNISARFVMAVLFSATYCLVVFAAGIAMCLKIVDVPTFISILATFALVVREITDAYFKRTDRGQTNAPSQP